MTRVRAVCGVLKAARGFIDVVVGHAAGEVIGVETGKHGHPVGPCLDPHEGVAGREVLGMEASVFDGKLPHHPAGELFAVQLLGKAVVLAEHVGLSKERRRSRQWLAREQAAEPLEDPGIPDRAAGDAHAIHAGLLKHCQAGRCREEIP